MNRFPEVIDTGTNIIKVEENPQSEYIQKASDSESLLALSL